MVFGAFFVEFIRISWGPALLDVFSKLHHVNTHAPGSGLVVYGVVLLLVLYAAPAGFAGLVRTLVTGRSARAPWAGSAGRIESVASSDPNT
jgi:hypothetical protein